jgi:multiple sugar transport system substrate-binding protein
MWYRWNRACGLLGALSLVAVLLAACMPGGQTSPTSPPAPAAGAGKVTLTFWNGFTGPDRPTVEELVRQFNERNPDVQVQMEIMPWDTLFQKLLPALQTGQGPDITGYATEHIARYASAGLIQPVDDLYGPNGLDTATLVGPLLENMQFGGKYYAAPMNFATLLLYYNKDLFRDAGLDPERPPTNWDELTSYAEKLTRDTSGDGAPDQYGFVIAARQTVPMWPILFWGNGGDYVQDGKSVFNSPQNLETLKRFAALIRDNKASPVGLTGADADKLFETRKAAMYFVGPWMTSGFTKAGLNFGVAPPPAGPKEQVTLGSGVAMVLNAGTEGPARAGAYEFFKFWNSKDSQVTWALGSGFPPTRTDVLDDPRLAQNPFIKEFAAVAPRAKFYLQGLQEFAAIEGEVIGPGIEAVLYGEMSEEEAIRKIDEGISRLLK